MSRNFVRLFARVRRRAGSSVGRMLACALALILILGNVAITAMPLSSPASACEAGSLRSMHAAHCLHDRHDTADAASSHQHGHDCACCHGAVCACPSLVGVGPSVMLLAIASRAHGRLVAPLLTRDYAAFVARSLRPPIA